MLASSGREITAPGSIPGSNDIPMVGLFSNWISIISSLIIILSTANTFNGNDYNTPDGTNIRDYIHVVDLAKAHVKTLEYLRNNSALYDVVNIGTGKGSSVLEVIETFQKVNDLKLPFRIGSRRAGDVEQVYAGVEKANKVLGWKSELTLEDALKDAWRWQESLNA